MIYITGDVHYPIDSLKLFVLADILKPDDYLIVCGDMGLAWSSLEDTNRCIKEVESKINYNLLFVDGNHEHFPLLTSFPEIQQFEGTVGKLSDHIFHLKRAQLYNIEGYRVVTFGGAASIDRGWRVPGIDWFPEEEFSPAEEFQMSGLVKHEKSFDFVITHDAPDSIVQKIYASTGGAFSSRTQKYLEYIMPLMTFDKWYFGHHHINKTFNRGKFVALYNQVRVLNTGKIFLEPSKFNEIK